MPISKEVETPILENEDVKKLLALLKKNQAQNGKALTAAVKQAASLEKQLAVAMDKLETMQQDLVHMRNHPLKTALQKAVISLQDRVLALRDNLAELKKGIIEGCKKALADVKLRGLAALDGAARFFHVRPVLESMRNNLNQSITIDEKAIAKIETISAEYHKAGRALKNMGRMLAGKEVIQEAKTSGKLAKTIEAPYKAELSCLRTMKNSVEKAIGNMARLEQAAQKKPHSVLKTLQEHKEQMPSQKKSNRERSHEER